MPPDNQRSERPHFNTGETYNRRRDLHARFGGQRQGGISTPSGHNVIFAFTGTSGAKHGYADAWTPDGVYRYFGEGQSGDMRLAAGNKAIAHHVSDGKDLLLFKTLGKGLVQFIGTFVCAGYQTERAPDRSGAMRDAIVFHLLPADAERVGISEEVDAKQSAKEDLMQLRVQAQIAAGPARRSSAAQARQLYFARSETVRRYVLARANGVCECCREKAPFVTRAGQPYLEPHHIRRLSDGGPDDPNFIGAICPNCHREIHHGAVGQALNEELQRGVAVREAELEKGTRN